MAGRFKDHNWDLANENGNIGTWERVQVAVLMDIRDELKRMNSVLNCPNFLRVPSVLNEIRRNTKKPRQRKKAYGAQ